MSEVNTWKKTTKANSFSSLNQSKRKQNKTKNPWYFKFLSGSSLSYINLKLF